MNLNSSKSLDEKIDKKHSVNLDTFLCISSALKTDSVRLFGLSWFRFEKSLSSCPEFVFQIYLPLYPFAKTPHGAENFDYAPGVQETTCQFDSIRASNAEFDDNQYSEASFEPATINTVHEPFGREMTFNGNGVRPETGKLNYVPGLHEEIRELDSMRVSANTSSAKFDDHQNITTSRNLVKHNTAHQFNPFNREFISSEYVSEFL